MLYEIIRKFWFSDVLGHTEIEYCLKNGLILHNGVIGNLIPIIPFYTLKHQEIRAF